ncbi:MAG: hypothetical protein ACI94Y_002541 [Maribacter sp.]|jgi:hypothetical protein
MIGHNDCKCLISKTNLILNFVALATGFEIAEALGNQWFGSKLLNHF